MIQAVLRIVAPQGKRDEVLEVFRGIQGPTEVTKGCRRCGVFRDAMNDEVFLYFVQWETRHELEQHFRSERFCHLLPYIEMSEAPPQVDISDVEVIGGIELMIAAIEERTK